MLSPQKVTASDFGIGARIYGDQLLMKDIVKTPAITLTEETVIKFNYAISQAITYIEMSSDEVSFLSMRIRVKSSAIH